MEQERSWSLHALPLFPASTVEANVAERALVEAIVRGWGAEVGRREVEGREEWGLEERENTTLCMVHGGG